MACKRRLVEQVSSSVLLTDAEYDISNVTTTDDDMTQFLEDPSLHQDELPQPFRRINKLLNVIVDAAWDIAAEREAKIIHEASRVRPPQYDTASHVEAVGSVTCLAASPDGKYAIVGKSDGGLACVRAADQCIEAEWKPEDGAVLVSFVHIVVTAIASDVYLLSAVNSSGAVQLFVHVVDIIFPAYPLFLNDDTSQKGIVSSCMVATGTDVMGLVVQSPEQTAEITSPSWLEIYRLPRDTWIKELDQVLEVLKRPTSSPCSVHEELSQTLSQTNTMQKSSSVQPVKLTAPTLILKARPPSQSCGTEGITWNNAYQLSKNVETVLHGGLIGTGTCHLVSKRHLEMRMAAFESVHQRHANILHSKNLDCLIPQTPAVRPNFHLLTSPEPYLSDLSSSFGPQTASVMVWWSGSSHIMHYNIQRSAKDVEASRADLVWPMSCPVVATAVSQCCLLVAVALSNNDILIWNRNIGSCIRVLKLDDPSPICTLLFHELPSHACRQYASPDLWLLVESGQGQIYISSTQRQDAAPPHAVYAEIENEGEVPALLQTVPGMPELLVINCQDGRLFVHDMIKRQLLCELLRPAMMCSPLYPQAFLTADGGRVLYTLVHNMSEFTDTPESADALVLLVYKLVYFPTFDCYEFAQQQQTIFSIQSTLDGRVSSAFHARFACQCERKERLEQQWAHWKAKMTSSPIVSKG